MLSLYHFVCIHLCYYEVVHRDSSIITQVLPYYCLFLTGSWPATKP